MTITSRTSAPISPIAMLTCSGTASTVASGLRWGTATSSPTRPETTSAHRVSHLFDGHRVTDGRLVWLRHGWPTLFDDLATALPRIREDV